MTTQTDPRQHDRYLSSGLQFRSMIAARPVSHSIIRNSSTDREFPAEDFWRKRVASTPRNSAVDAKSQHALDNYQQIGFGVSLSSAGTWQTDVRKSEHSGIEFVSSSLRRLSRSDWLTLSKSKKDGLRICFDIRHSTFDIRHFLRLSLSKTPQPSEVGRTP